MLHYPSAVDICVHLRMYFTVTSGLVRHWVHMYSVNHKKVTVHL